MYSPIPWIPFVIITNVIMYNSKGKYLAYVINLVFDEISIMDTTRRDMDVNMSPSIIDINMIKGAFIVIFTGTAQIPNLSLMRINKKRKRYIPFIRKAIIMPDISDPSKLIFLIPILWKRNPKERD